MQNLLLQNSEMLSVNNIVLLIAKQIFRKQYLQNQEYFQRQENAKDVVLITLLRKRYKDFAQKDVKQKLELEDL